MTEQDADANKKEAALSKELREFKEANRNLQLQMDKVACDLTDATFESRRAVVAKDGEVASLRMQLEQLSRRNEALEQINKQNVSSIAMLNKAMTIAAGTPIAGAMARSTNNVSASGAWTPSVLSPRAGRSTQRLAAQLDALSQSTNAGNDFVSGEAAAGDRLSPVPPIWLASPPQITTPARATSAAAVNDGTGSSAAAAQGSSAGIAPFSPLDTTGTAAGLNRGRRVKEQTDLQRRQAALFGDQVASELDEYRRMT